MSVLREVSQTVQGVQDSSTVKRINNLLNSSKTRLSGLELLNSYLPYCSDDDFIEWCVNWMQNCCKVDEPKKNSTFGITVLGSLFKISSNYQELKKSVSFFISTRYFDYFFKYFINSQAGWSCTETCFLLYRGACGPFQESLEKHLKKQVDGSKKISSNIARCFALFPCLGGGGNEGVNYKNNWRNQFIKFLNICHSLLNDLFMDIEEFQEYDLPEYCNVGKEERNKSLEALTTQLHNYCSILNFMLLNQYPAVKSVPTDLTFQLICRGLAVSPKALQKQETTDTVALLKVLPEIHDILLSLLKGLIVTCRTQLLPYSYLICKLIKQALEWTESDFGLENKNPFEVLRISAYETLGNWLVMARSGSCIESVSNSLLSSAVSDFSFKKEVVLLKESKGTHKSKRREQNTRRLDIIGNSRLCLAALKALQFLIKFAGVLLKAEEHRCLQEIVVKVISEIQNKSASNMIGPFSESTCRKELYSLLLELVYNPCPNWAPPTHFALRLFSKGENDWCPQVSKFCSTAISYLNVITHPHFDNGGFPTSDISNEKGRGGVTLEYNEPMDVESTMNESALDLEKGNEASAEDEPERKEISFEKDQEKISEESGVSSDEDSTNTVPYPKADELTEKDITKDEEDEKIEENPEIVLVGTDEGNEPVPKKRKSEDFDLRREKTPSPKKTDGSPSPDTKGETAERGKTPKRVEESASTKSVSPESSNEEGIPKKRYFLRSVTCKASSEEPEEVKRTSSPESARNTPTRGLLKGSPSIQNSTNRPRTRAHSKTVETECESSTRKRSSNDDDENIIDAFHDSFVDES